MGKNINLGVRKAIQLTGGTRQSLANVLEVSQEAVRKMELVNCSPQRAIEIEEKVPGVTREEIRPDIFLKNYKRDPNNTLRLHTPKSILEEVLGSKEQKEHTEILNGASELKEPAEIILDNPDPIVASEPDELKEDLRAEIVERIKKNPNIDIARPGRKVIAQPNHQ